jgi:two-component system chemotaxis response regulator CheY
MKMKTLVVEDEFTSRRLLQRILSPYGEVDVAIDGKEAIEAFRLAMEEKLPYTVICLDIMLPEIDGQEVLREIRKVEEEKGVHGLKGAKIIMTTALDDTENVMEAFKSQCDAYIVKPIDKKKLLDQLQALGLLQEVIP